MQNPSLSSSTGRKKVQSFLFVHKKQRVSADCQASKSAVCIIIIEHSFCNSCNANKDRAPFCSSYRMILDEEDSRRGPGSETKLQNQVAQVLDRKSKILYNIIAWQKKFYIQNYIILQNKERAVEIILFWNR